MKDFFPHTATWLKRCLLLLLLLPATKSKASDDVVMVADTIFLGDTSIIRLLEVDERPNPILQLIKNKRKKNKKTFATILAFPFPFGMVALHRIYLGTSPYVPVAYIASLGGVFGILPFIDFCVLLLDKDVDRYVNNPRVFMWVTD